MQYVASGSLQGYLAYQGNKIVGWCNANTKADCLKCASRRRFMGHVPLGDLKQGLKVKSVFCFVIAPEMRRQGIAARLLEHVCREAAQEGFEVVEADPWKQWGFGGYYEMYKNSGFAVVQETESGYVMRRQLKHPGQSGRL